MDKDIIIRHSAASMAYIGDAVFELYVREMLLSRGNKSVHDLNKQALNYVSAAAQAAMYYNILPVLTLHEKSIMKRGRNLHSQSRAKNANTAEYRHATGLETLFGYLFLKNEHDRIKEIFENCVNMKEPENVTEL